MENPYEKQQIVLLGRIIQNVTKLNQSIAHLNKSLEILNKENDDVAAVSQMWSAYDNSVQIHLNTTKTLSQPLSPL